MKPITLTQHEASQGTGLRLIARAFETEPPSDFHFLDIVDNRVWFGNGGLGLRPLLPLTPGVYWVQEEWRVDLIDWEMAVVEYRDGSTKSVPFEKAISAPARVHDWKPAETMPRWASRFTVTVGQSEVLRVEDVTEEQAEAMGFDNTASPLTRVYWAFHHHWTTHHPDAEWVCLYETKVEGRE